MSLLPSPERPDPVHCGYCEEGFVHERDLALHRGRVHAELVSEEETRAFESAREAERRWLDRLRRHLRSGLAALPVLSIYAVVLVAGYVYRAEPTLLVLPLPGILGFAALTYYLAYRHQDPA